MAKKTKDKPRKKPSRTIPLSVVGGFTPYAAAMYDHAKRGDGHAMAWVSQVTFTGINPDTGKWAPDLAKQYMFPWIRGLVTHKVANYFGVNRIIARTGMPWLRI